MPLDATTKEPTTRSLADFTRCDLIVPELRERDPAGIIGELSQALGRSDCVSDALSFYQAALNQEILSDVTTQSHIAIAHARLTSVKRLQFAFGRAPVPVLWSAKSSWPVQMIFLLAVPATESARYLQLLSSMSRLAQNPEVIGKMIAAPDDSALFAIFETVRLHLEISGNQKYVIL